MHRPKEHVMETVGDRIFATQVPPEWIYRKIEMDYGLDREIEIVDAENVTGKKLLIQVKASESPKIADMSVRFRLTTDKLEYYSRNDLPVLLVLVDLKTKICYWLFVHEYVEKLKMTKPSWRQQKTVILEIPASNTWQECIDTIRKVAFKGPEFIALKKLSVSPDLGKVSTGINTELLGLLQKNIENLSFTSFCGIAESKLESESRVLGVEEQYIVRTYAWAVGRTDWGMPGSTPTRSAPGGAMLTGSTGDLVFAINTTHPFSDILAQVGSSSNILQILGIPGKPENYDTVLVYLPPGFTLRMIDGSSVVTTHIGANIQAFRVSQFDLYAPGWTVVCVTTNQNASGGSVVVNSDREDVHSFDRDYYVRLKSVTAPRITGKYFFKIALVKRNREPEIQSGKRSVNSTELGVRASNFVNPDSWPVLFVKGEVNPAFITGTVRCGNQALPPLRGEPIREAGCVYAKMTMRLDPYTGHECPDLPRVDAVGYFNAREMGHYELHGLAPGEYLICAQAAGYPAAAIASNVKVLKGASLQFDGYLQPGPVIHGEVLAKNKLVDDPWCTNAEIKIQFFDSPTLQFVPDPSSRMVSWSPSRLASQQNTVAPRRGPQDVGPPQEWVVQRNQTAPFHFEFGVKNVYGAPRDLSGMVPQVYATWINGLNPGRYFVRAWVSGYDQSGDDGSTFREYYFDINPNDGPRELTLKIALRRA